jgi:2-polyprenyl-3-methyl-5-hydroxy-6-metoxy-1,4-benzoquinol methylase
MMTWLDRLLQSWRIAKVRRWLNPSDRVLDVGCFDGALFRRIKSIQSGLGIDADAEPASIRGIDIRRGTFPGELPAEDSFDVITALAVFEHVARADQAPFIVACLKLLRQHGRVVLTIPSPKVDRLLPILQALHLLHGIRTDEHWGFDPSSTSGLFEGHGFSLEHHSTFQLGLNHLFVFSAP